MLIIIITIIIIIYIFLSGHRWSTWSAMTRSLRAQACAQWWRASGDEVKPNIVVKPSLGTWRECHTTFQLTKHWDYRSRHQLVDDLTAIGSAALVVLATAGSTNSVMTISAHLLTYGEQQFGVVTLERRYGPRRLRDDDDDDDDDDIGRNFTGTIIIRHSESANLRQRQNFNQKWSEIRIQISGLIRFRMSVGSVPKCCGYDTIR